MTDLRQLQYFIACVETGSFSEAARILYTTQSSVSKAMKAMEESMGLLLFERMPRALSLQHREERYTAMPAEFSKKWKL